MTTAIEWTDAKWNPTTGCTNVGPCERGHLSRTTTSGMKRTLAQPARRPNQRIGALCFLFRHATPTAAASPVPINRMEDGSGESGTRGPAAP